MIVHTKLNEKWKKYSLTSISMKTSCKSAQHTRLITVKAPILPPSQFSIVHHGVLRSTNWMIMKVMLCGLLWKWVLILFLSTMLITTERETRSWYLLTKSAAARTNHHKYKLHHDAIWNHALLCNLKLWSQIYTC